MLIDILNSLKIEDTTQSTKIIEKISLIFASLNEVKADLVRTLNALRSKEATGEFYAQMTLLEQGIVSFLDFYLPKNVKIILLGLCRRLESKFGDFPTCFEIADSG